MFNNSKKNFKEIAKDAKVFGASLVCLAKDVAYIAVAFCKDMKEIVTEYNANNQKAAKQVKAAK